MQQEITLKNIAQRVGLSVSTVSRVLNNQSEKYRISEKTQIRINKIASELNYSPNQLARGLRLNKTHTIAYIIPDISNPFFSSIAKNIEKYVRKFGYSIILCDSEESTDIEKSIISMMLDRKVDGLIISPVGLELAHLEKILKKRIPILLLDRYFPNLKIPYVTSDNYQGAFDAVSLLIKNGHRRIACIQGLRNTSPNNDRLKGYIQAHKKYNIPIDESLIVGDSFGEENGYTKTKLLLKQKNKPTAIFAVSNLISLGALRALTAAGFKVPENISMISFDDQPYSNFLSTPMTTVAQQNLQIGQLAAKKLLELIDSKGITKPEGYFIPTKLIIRSSVKNINLL